MATLDTRHTRSTCPYCGVGCGVIIESQGEQITGVRGDPEHPANRGRLCSKGQTLHLSAAPHIGAQTRLLQPLHRATRGAAPQPLGWDAALTLATERVAHAVHQHGPDAVGFYISGQLLTEDYYAFNKLAKGLIGTNNIDTNSRLCMSSAVAGYKQTLGADAPPACYDDIDHAGCLFIAGSNTAYAHPVLFRRIEAARQANPTLRLVVVDPRRTDTAAAADLHLPLAPGTDVMLFHGLLHIMLREGWIDRDHIARHTTGFDALAALVQDCPPARVAQVCGLPQADLFTAARWFAWGGQDTPPPSGRAPTLSLYCQGLNQSSSGTDKNATLIGLHLATGQIGRPGAGPFSLTGQPNAMGGREVGGLANLLSAHRDLANPAHRAEVAALWGVPSVPERPGLSAVEMFQAAADGQLRVLWIACTNPAQSMPDQATVRRALERAEFVVVQEAFAHTATAAHADLLLPATTWGEKDGTVTNSERCISRVRPAVPAPGQARHDWRIAVDLARRLQPVLRPELPDLFPFSTPQAIWEEHRESTRGRDLDITGLSYARLEHLGPQPWPLPAGQTEGRRRLYTDHRYTTPDGRARFVAAPYRPVSESCDERFPLALTTGRLRDQWHGMSRTGTLGRLFGHVNEPQIELNPGDLQGLGLRDGELVRVAGHRGELVLPAKGSDGVLPGRAFTAMHWGSEYLGGRGADGQPALGVNTLTNATACPHSRQPELKHAAVRVEGAKLPWRLVAMAWLPDDRALTVREQLRELMAAFPFASCVPFGRERTGLCFRAADRAPATDEQLQRIEHLLGLDRADALRYADASRGQRRCALLDGEGDQRPLRGFLLAGQDEAEAWLRPLLLDEAPATALGWRLLMPGTQAPAGQPPRGRQVCTCLNVSDTAIQGHLAQASGSPDERLASLQAALRCGTQCGSCVPELRRLIAVAPAPVCL